MPFPNEDHPSSIGDSPTPLRSDDSLPEGLSRSGEAVQTSSPSGQRPVLDLILLVSALVLASLGTLYAGGWLKSAVIESFAPSPELNPLLDAIFKTLMAASWLTPLVLVPRLRDAGSFRLPFSWTVVLLLPLFLLPNAVFSHIPREIPITIVICRIWEGLMTGVFEEAICRGYAFRHSPQSYPRLTIMITALGFALTHLINVHNERLANVLLHLPFYFISGINFGIIRLTTGSLAWCMLIHGLVNAIPLSRDAGDEYFAMGRFVLLIGLVTGVILLFVHPRLRSNGPIALK